MFDQPAFENAKPANVPLATLLVALLVVYILGSLCRNLAMVAPTFTSLPVLLVLMFAGLYAGAFLINASYLAYRLRPAAKQGSAKSPSWRGLMMPPLYYASAGYAGVIMPQGLAIPLSGLEPPISTLGLLAIAIGTPILVYILLIAGYRIARSAFVAAQIDQQ
jgi:hypothetical protein